MIKVLRITGIISVVLAAVFLFFSVFLGVRRDKQAEGFLNTAGAIEEFTKAKAKGKQLKKESQSSPLVKQAEAFALYLNPPKPEPSRQSVSRQAGGGPRPQSVSPKFKLIGTSFYASHPDLSLALIDEPGKGFRWVRQSSEVGHLVIAQIKDGSVVIRDGQKTNELMPERPEKTNLVKETSADANAGDSKAQQAGSGKSKTSASGRADSSITRRKRRQIRTEEAKEQVPLSEGIIPELEAMRISAEEAERLDRLGKELNDVQQEPNQAEDDISEGDANLGDANFGDANLIDANVDDANLSDANLSDANLAADLNDANEDDVNSPE